MEGRRHCERCGDALVPAVRPDHKPECPACGWFRPTEALPVVLVLARTADGRILYTRQPGWPADAWGLVSGYVEAGETAEGASLREVGEETGMRAREPRLLWTVAMGEKLLICVEVAIDDGVPHAGSDVHEVMLRSPDLSLTPEGWPARQLIETRFASRSS